MVKLERSLILYRPPRRRVINQAAMLSPPLLLQSQGVNHVCDKWRENSRAERSAQICGELATRSHHNQYVYMTLYKTIIRSGGLESDFLKHFLWLYLPFI